jgi:glycosyltransferase involved in cell wall biosynthesis
MTLCVISPVRDEAAYARRTLDSMVAQTVRPDRWVIVDDGSTDDTPAILAEYAARHDWITVIRREDRGFRKVGGGVIDAFYAGYDAVDATSYDYVCKLDLDLDLPPRYFEILLGRMEADPRIGTCSGKPWVERDGELVDERNMTGGESSVGMTKLYRTSCFIDIGGFVREVMWDGIDGHRCRMHGWIAVSWNDPDLRFVHLRPMGSSQTSWWTGRVRHGYGQWFMGTGFAYMLASSVFRMAQPPYVIGGIGMLWGWLRSALRRDARYGDREFRRFLRRWQWAALLKGKARALRDLDARQAAVWTGAASAGTGSVAKST